MRDPIPDRSPLRSDRSGVATAPSLADPAIMARVPPAPGVVVRATEAVAAAEVTTMETMAFTNATSVTAAEAAPVTPTATD